MLRNTKLYLPHRHENMNRTASKHRDSFARMPAGVVALPQGLSTPAQTDRQNTECRSMRGGAGVLDRVEYGLCGLKKAAKKARCASEQHPPETPEKQERLFLVFRMPNAPGLRQHYCCPTAMRGLELGTSCQECSPSAVKLVTRPSR